jgi:hypothetical protein
VRAATSKYIQRYVPTHSRGTSEDHVSNQRPAPDRKPTDLSAQAKKAVKAARGMLRGDTTQNTGKGTKNRFEVEGVVLRYTTRNGWATMDGTRGTAKVSKQASITLAQALSRPLPGKKGQTVHPLAYVFCRETDREKRVDSTRV